MSHFTVLVIGENVDAQLAPFQENNMGDCPPRYLKFIVPNEHGENSVFDSELEARAAGADVSQGRLQNPRSKWDWWVVGGRWTGFFLPIDSGTMRYPADAKPGEPGVMTEPAEPPYVDSIRKCDLDLDSMRRLARLEAQAEWNQYRAAVGSQDPPDMVKLRAAFPAIQDLREALLAHPWTTKMRAANLNSWNPEYYTGTGAQFIKRAVDRVLLTHAVLINGQWHQQGEAGWWGAVHHDKDPETWHALFWNIFNSLSPDTLLTVVDCHI
jgi:hypothetical protein